MPRSKAALTRTVVLIVLAVVACVVSVIAIPPDARIGSMVRFVMFHGASTWVNMLTFTLAGIFGIAFLFGRAKARRWGEAFRWIALPHWTLNTVLGMLSMKLLWGAILWDEPRLIMTFGLLAGSVIIIALQLIFDHPKLTAALDAVLAVALWVLVLVLPNLFHPDSPVFNSANPVYIIAFFGMVLSIAVIAVTVATAIARRRTPDGDEQTS